ncbi:RsiV family protein [Enterocloster citroniae]|uniref:RsiV family protein n=1 Tax=Enterocloster citroniae TaxID=358743 RepID=UPI0032C18BE5
MSRLEDAKKKYDKTEIPKELSKRVQAAVEESGARKREREKVVRIRRRKVLAGKCAGVAAGLAIVFTTALNTNTAFADMAARLPVVGGVARLLTFRSYEKDEGDWKISVKIPSVEMIAVDTNGLDDSLNQEIHELCIRYGEEAQQRAMEYKKAFMETGGTEEEWAAHNIEINVWYEIKSQTEDYLSFAVMGTESWTSAYSEARYYSIDLKNGKLATLQTLLGDEYVRKADESIQTAMRERQETEGIEFRAQDEGGFSGIDENTKFYVNEKGNPVIVFDKYEIAPGAYGAMEFEVER